MDNPEQSKAKRLRNSTGQMSKVYINRDMSKEERARDYELRTMLAEKRRSGERWKLRKGILVRDEVNVRNTGMRWSSQG